MRVLPFLSCHRLALGIVLPFLAAPVWAQDSVAQKTTLKGVAVAEVIVEAMDPVAEREGLTRSQLQADVESRLRQAGITVGPTPAGHLYVNVDTVKGDHRKKYAYNVLIQYMQQVVLPHDPKTPILAPTWETGGVGMIGADHLREVGQDVANYLDQFIKGYLEQNPK